MSKFRSARAVLAGTAVVALAGCGASASSSDAASGTTSAAATSSAGSSPGATPGTTSNSFVATGSTLYPIAVGNTWVYQTTTGANAEEGLQTNKVLSVVPVPGGQRVTMSETTGLHGVKTASEENLIFYSNGKIAYPVAGGEVSVLGSGVLWPTTAELASGQVFHSVLRIKVLKSGAAQDQDANVTVQGQGTSTVTVPAGTYQATLVTMTMSLKVGDESSTEEVQTWVAPGTGPVKTKVSLGTVGSTVLTSTDELLSFTKG
jgi:uncharacterized protein DUF3108